MREKRSTWMPRVLGALGILALAGLAWLGAPRAQATELESLAEALWRSNGSAADSAALALRQAGPPGMAAALAALERCPPGSCGQPAALDRLDRICGVRDCRDIRLFWHTDFEAAKRAAETEGKPILSLRLLGRLDEEMSCANSRFFRTVLYANREIGELLRDDFVLYWQSLREVPKVTIDFGDGRKLEQTVTGNSVHYLLDPHGRLLDVLPGLYGPLTFHRNLELVRNDAASANLLEDAAFASWAKQRHTSTLRRLDRALELVRAAVKPSDSQALLPTAADRNPWRVPKPKLRQARVVRDTASKAAGEVTLLESIDIAVEASDEELARVASASTKHVKLDAASREFLARKQGVVHPAARQRLIESFEWSLAQDEALNEYRYRRAALRRLIRSGGVPPSGLERFNEWVYESLFEAPIRDPWMGLRREDVYAALPPPVIGAP